jgi:hypothetical protein
LAALEHAVNQLTERLKEQKAPLPPPPMYITSIIPVHFSCHFQFSLCFLSKLTFAQGRCSLERDR